jgi:hypothetical protein
MPLQADQDLDLVTTTLKDLGELRWTDITSSVQEHVFLNVMLTKYKVGFGSGYAIQWNVQVNPTGSARMTGMMATDNVNIVDTMTTASIPWRHATTNWAIDDRELAINREPRRIVELIKTRRAGSMMSLAELLETQGWSQPTNSDDNLNVFGIPYWIVPDRDQGFNGGNPFGFAAGAGGLSSVTYPNWRNYTDSYVDPTKLDLIRKWRRAARFTKFMAPVNVKIPTYSPPTGQKYGYYTTNFVMQRLEEAAEQQNDNLGNDVASKDDSVVFRRIPVTWVPKLEDLSGQGMSGTFVDATYASTGGMPVAPVYGICWDCFRPVFLEGWYMKEYGPNRVPGQHTLMSTHVDTTLNLECRDRRRNFVLTM